MDAPEHQAAEEALHGGDFLYDKTFRRSEERNSCLYVPNDFNHVFPLGLFALRYQNVDYQVTIAGNAQKKYIRGQGWRMLLQTLRDTITFGVNDQLRMILIPGAIEVQPIILISDDEEDEWMVDADQADDQADQQPADPGWMLYEKPFRPSEERNRCLYIPREFNDLSPHRDDFRLRYQHFEYQVSITGNAQQRYIRGEGWRELLQTLRQTLQFRVHDVLRLSFLQPGIMVVHPILQDSDDEEDD